MEYAGRPISRSEAFAEDGSEGSEPPASAGTDEYALESLLSNKVLSGLYTLYNIWII